MALAHKHCGCRSENARQEELAHISFAWTLSHTSNASKTVLGALPFRLDLKPLGGHVAGPTVTLVHATPTSNLVYVTEDRTCGFPAKMADSAGLKAGDVICFGHTHQPWHRTVGGVHFVNTGSVGRPKDGDARAGVRGARCRCRQRARGVRARGYDMAATIAGVISAGLPEEFARFLETGGTS